MSLLSLNMNYSLGASLPPRHATPRHSGQLLKLRKGGAGAYGMETDRGQGRRGHERRRGVEINCMLETEKEERHEGEGCSISVAP